MTRSFWSSRCACRHLFFSNLSLIFGKVFHNYFTALESAALQGAGWWMVGVGCWAGE